MNGRVEIALTLVTLVAIAIAGSVVAERYTVSTPLLLIVLGAAASYLPMVPEFELTPTIVLVGLLPPLLYASAIQTSLIDFAANRRPIALLSVGLVVFTVVGVGALVHQLLPVSWPVAFALGAVVAPPDAVAASAVARRAGMPRRIVTILEGESLVNDATAIVTLRTAIAATAGAVSVWEVGAGFLISAVGGVLVGMAVALVVGKIRRRLEDDLADVAVSLLTPWVAYVVAEEIHVPGVDFHPSGVLAVVVAGLLLGHKSPVIQSATSRLFERTNWATLSFVLENTVFLLIGLQAESIVTGLAGDDLGAGRIALASALVLVTVIVLRMVWIYPATYLPRLIPSVRRVDPAPPWPIPTVVGWAGMRGVVTLAAVFLLPPDTPHRPVLVMIAFVVTVGTLLIQGLTLPSLLRILKVSGPDPHEDPSRKQPRTRVPSTPVWRGWTSRETTSTRRSPSGCGSGRSIGPMPYGNGWVGWRRPAPSTRERGLRCSHASEPRSSTCAAAAPSTRPFCVAYSPASMSRSRSLTRWNLRPRPTETLIYGCTPASASTSARSVPPTLRHHAHPAHARSACARA